MLHFLCFKLECRFCAAEFRFYFLDPRPSLSVFLWWVLGWLTCSAFRVDAAKTANAKYSPSFSKIEKAYGLFFQCSYKKTNCRLKVSDTDRCIAVDGLMCHVCPRIMLHHKLHTTTRVLIIHCCKACCVVVNTLVVVLICWYMWLSRVSCALHGGSWLCKAWGRAHAGNSYRHKAFHSLWLLSAGMLIHQLL